MIYLNEVKITPTIFPDKTSQVWQLPLKFLDDNHVIVTWEFADESEFLHLAQLKDLLDHYGATADLKLPYLPYGRQDKDISNEQTFALKTFSFLLNRLCFKSVIITDPHSKVALDLIFSSRAEYPLGQVSEAFKSCESDLVCYPDKGALNKYCSIYDYPFIYGQKVRDGLTGAILSYHVQGNVTDKRVLILDDICDGGGTFTLLAKDLLQLGAKEVNLFVSHGLFTKGTQLLFDSGIKRIFTKAKEIKNEV